MKIHLLELVNLNNIYFLCIIVFSLNALFWIFKVVFVKNWIEQRQKIKHVITQHDQGFYVLIPVLNEEKIILDTAQYFSKLIEKYPNAKIVFITTSKETEKTIEKIKELSRSVEKIIHYHYTGSGVMAHQLNFALKEINSIEQQDVFIVVYNADSRPDPRTFSYVFTQKSNNKKVFQQYGDYTYNIGNFKNNILIKSILTSSTIVSIGVLYREAQRKKGLIFGSL